MHLYFKLNLAEGSSKQVGVVVVGSVANFFSRNTGLLLAKLGTTLPYIKGAQVFHTKGHPIIQTQLMVKL